MSYDKEMAQIIREDFEKMNGKSMSDRQDNSNESTDASASIIALGKTVVDTCGPDTHAIVDEINFNAERIVVPYAGTETTEFDTPSTPPVPNSYRANLPA